MRYAVVVILALLATYANAFAQDHIAAGAPSVPANTGVSSSSIEQLTIRDYEAALREANAQTSVLAQRAQALSAQLNHTNELAATLAAQLAEVRKSKSVSSPMSDKPKNEPTAPLTIPDHP